METTSKFHQLCAVYDAAQVRFEEYKKNCHLFSIEFTQHLKEYYQIPEKQFSLYRIDREGRFDLVPSSLIHAIDLFDDHYWHFGIGLTVCRAPETLPEELILIHLFFRKEEGKEFFLKHTLSDKEFEVFQGKKDSFIPFLDDLFNTIRSSYDGYIQQFIGERTTRKLGFKQ